MAVIVGRVRITFVRLLVEVLPGWLGCSRVARMIPHPLALPSQCDHIPSQLRQRGKLKDPLAQTLPSPT